MQIFFRRKEMRAGQDNDGSCRIMIVEKFAIIDMVRSKTPSTSNYKFKENNKMLQTSLRRSLKTPQKGINSNFSIGYIFEKFHYKDSINNQWVGAGFMSR